MNPIISGLAASISLIAGYTDWRTRRIPNWLTLSGLTLGFSTNAVLGGVHGLKESALGAGLGLLVLLPFVFLRSLGGGDWKLAGALGACVGPGALANLLMLSIFVAGIMALALVIYKRRTIETLRNMAHILASMVRLQMPGSQVTLDNPRSLKVPYGVALAVSTIAYGLWSWKTTGWAR